MQVSHIADQIYEWQMSFAIFMYIFQNPKIPYGIEKMVYVMLLMLIPKSVCCLNIFLEVAISLCQI